MKVYNLNSSSKKTEQKIKEAFAELLKEKKELSKITVTELTKRIEISRGAFYTHYDSIYDVAKDFQNETLNLLKFDFKNLNSIDEINLFLDKIFDYLKENEYVYSMILSSDEPLIYANKLRKYLAKNLYSGLKYKNIPNLDLNISFFTDGSINLIIKFFRKEISESLDEIKYYVKTIAKKFFIL